MNTDGSSEMDSRGALKSLTNLDANQRGLKIQNMVLRKDRYYYTIWEHKIM